MRNLSILLPLMVLCAVVLSSGERERRSYTDEDDKKAALQILLQAIDEGKVDIKDLITEKENNPIRRLWFGGWRGKQ